MHALSFGPRVPATIHSGPFLILQPGGTATQRDGSLRSYSVVMTAMAGVGRELADEDRRVRRLPLAVDRARAAHRYRHLMDREARLPLPNGWTPRFMPREHRGGEGVTSMILGGTLAYATPVTQRLPYGKDPVTMQLTDVYDIVGPDAPDHPRIGNEPAPQEALATPVWNRDEKDRSIVRADELGTLQRIGTVGSFRAPSDGRFTVHTLLKGVVGQDAVGFERCAVVLARGEQSAPSADTPRAVNPGCTVPLPADLAVSFITPSGQGATITPVSFVAHPCVTLKRSGESTLYRTANGSLVRAIEAGDISHATGTQDPSLLAEMFLSGWRYAPWYDRRATMGRERILPVLQGIDVLELGKASARLSDVLALARSLGYAHLFIESGRTISAGDPVVQDWALHNVDSRGEEWRVLGKRSPPDASSGASSSADERPRVDHEAS